MSFRDLVSGVAPSEMTFLVGAGVSYDAPASLPTVNRFLRDVLDACGARDDLIALVLARAATSPVPRFEGLVEEIAKLRDPTFRLTSIFDSPTFNEMHSALAVFLAAGSTVVTTNFDNCIEHAAGGALSSRVVFTGRDADEDARGPGLLKPHGSHPLSAGEARSQLVASIAGISLTTGGFSQLPKWRSLLRASFDGRVLIVAGYSGSDDFDLTPLLLESRPRMVLWISHGAGESAVECDPASIPNFGPLASLDPLRTFVGPTSRILCDAASVLKADLKNGGPGAAMSTADYVAMQFPSGSQRTELLHLVYLYFGLYEALLEPVPFQTTGLVLQRMKALFRLGRHAEVIDLVHHLPLASMSADEQFEAHYFFSSALSYSGQVKEAVREAEAAVKAAEQHNLVGRMNALNQLGGAYFQDNRIDDAEGAFRRSLALQADRPHIAAEATSTWGLASVLGVRKDLEGSLAMFLRVRSVFSALGDDMNLAWADYNCADVYMNLGKPVEAHSHAQSAEIVFRRLKLQMGIVYVLWLQARMSYRGGDLLAAARALDELRTAGSQQDGFLWLLDFALLHNCVRAKIGLPLEAFLHESFARRLYRLDRQNGRRLRRLLENPTARRIDAAEKWVFGGLLVRQ